MSKFADKVRQDLIRAIDQDELVLPTLPEVALRVRETMEDPDANIQALSEMIGGDVTLTVRIIRVVNSPLLRGPKEITNLQMAISRLGISYTCNLAVGLTMEQMFQATADVVDHKMREVWNKSTEIAGTCYVLARHYAHPVPNQATLAGLVHQTGVLSVPTYAGGHNKLPSDSINLSHVVERIHPLVGERILKAWDFPAPIAEVPRQYLDLIHDSPRTGYTDLVQVATLQNYFGSEHPCTRLDWSQTPAFVKPGLELAVDMREDEDLSSALEAAASILQQARPAPPGSMPVPASRPVHSGQAGSAPDAPGRPRR